MKPISSVPRGSALFAVGHPNLAYWIVRSAGSHPCSAHSVGYKYSGPPRPRPPTSQRYDFSNQNDKPRPRPYIIQKCGTDHRGTVERTRDSLEAGPAGEGDDSTLGCFRLFFFFCPFFFFLFFFCMSWMIRSEI